MKSKILFVLAAMALIAMLALASANMTKVSAATYSGSCGENVNWSYNTSTGELTISGSGMMNDYSSKSYNGTYATSAPWGQYYSSIKTVTINNGVTSIGSRAFSGCEGLTSITIPDSVMSIGSRAFSGCTGLTSITIPDSVTSISLCAFSYCTGLTSITIPDSVTSIGEAAFCDCTGLTSITIPSSVTSIGDYSFYECTGLTSITIPDSGTSIGYEAFYNCTGLTSITIPDSVTSIGSGAFDNTAWYKNQPDGLVYAGKVAYKYKGTCPSSVTIKSGTLGIAGSAFYDCTGLTSITIPDSVTSIGDYAFYNCTRLKRLILPDNVSSVGSSFQGSASVFIRPNTITEATLRSANIYFEYYNGNVLYSVSNGNATINGLLDNSVTSFAFPYTLDGFTVSSIGNSAFSGCTGLTNINVVNSVTSIGGRAFYGCTGLTSITIPNSVTSIGSSAFRDCTGLTSITIHDSVTSIGGSAFDGCKNLIITANYKTAGYNYAIANNIPLYKTVTGVPSAPKALLVEPFSITLVSVANAEYSLDKTNWQSENVFSGLELEKEYTFYLRLVETSTSYPSETSSGTKIKTQKYSVPAPDAPVAEKIEARRVVLSAIEGMEYSNDKTNWQTSNEFTGFLPNTSHTFYIRVAETETSYASPSSTPLTVTTADGGVIDSDFIYTVSDGKATITGFAYKHYSGELVIPSVLDGYTVTAIGNSTFSGCTGLTSITIPDSVTRIGNSAFQSCTGLTSVTFGNSVTSIGASAFSGCSGIDSLTLPASVTSIGASAFAGMKDYSLNFESFVSDSAAVGYFKSNNIKFTVGYGAKNFWGYDPATKTLRIFGSGATADYMSAASTPWNGLSSEVKHIVIDEGITRLGNFSFRSFTSLENVTFGDPDITFGYYVFPAGFKAVNPHTAAAPELVYKTDSSVQLKELEGYEYRMGTSEWQSSPLFEGLNEGESYTFTQRIAENSVYAPSEISETLSVTTVLRPSAPTLASVEGTTVTLNTVDGVEYSLSGEKWQTSTVFENVPTDIILEFYARTAATEISEESKPSAAKKVLIVGEPKVYSLIDGVLTFVENKNVPYEYSTDGVAWQTSPTFEDVPPIDILVFQRAASGVDASVYYLNEGATTFHGTHTEGAEEELKIGSQYFKVIRCSECGAILKMTEFEKQFAGDANGDEEISALDIVHLKKLLSQGGVAYTPELDANGDGVVDSLDVVRLKRYFAEYDIKTGRSTVVLGKA